MNNKKNNSYHIFAKLFLTFTILIFIAGTSYSQRKNIMNDVINKYSHSNIHSSKNMDIKNEISSSVDIQKTIPSTNAKFCSAAKVDLSIILALHPEMAFYSPNKGRFLKKFNLGENEDEAIFNYKKLQKKVFENEKIFKKDKLRLIKELKAIKTRYFSLRIEKNQKLNKLKLDLNKKLFETPKIDVAGLEKNSTSSIIKNTKNTKKRFEDLYEADSNEIEAEFVKESQRVAVKIETSEKALEKLTEKIESPLYLSRSESLKKLKNILAEINKIVKSCATKNGFTLVFNDSFSRYKYKKMTLPEEVKGMNISAPYYPSDDISEYLKAIAKKAPSEDPVVKNVKGHQETLVYYIRDHLFSDSSVRNFYSQYYSRAFMFGKIDDLTNKTVALMLKKHLFSKKKIALILQALDR